MRSYKVTTNLGMKPFPQAVCVCWFDDLYAALDEAAKSLLKGLMVTIEIETADAEES